MITVLPAGEERSRELLTSLGLNDGVCLLMADRATELGYAVYTLSGKIAGLVALESAEDDLIELLVRAALNSALLRGAEKMTVMRADLLPKIARFAFDKTATGAEIEIDAFFNRPCPSSGCAGCTLCNGKS